MIRAATPADEPALRALDRRIWCWLHAPVEPRDRRFDTEGVLVDITDGEIAGYVKLGEMWPIESVNHVREIKGLAVDTRKVTLRVLGHNAPARGLYAACGFEVEGVLRDLFLLDGRYVDDILMSLDLTGDSS